MRKRLLVLFLSVCFATTSAIAFIGCNSNQDDKNETSQIEQIYTQYVAYAQDAGEEPLSYEEWLASIKGEKGDQGVQGEKGEKGDQGADGKNGTSLLTGRSKPTANVGIVGDSYIDLSSWNFYVKTTDGWVFSGNIKGRDSEGSDNSSTDYSELNGSYRLSHIMVGDSIYKLGDDFFGMTLYPERICTELNDGVGTMSFDFGNFFVTNITYYVEDNNFVMVCEDEVDLYNDGNKQKELEMSMEEIDGTTYFVLVASNGYNEFSYYIEKISLTLEALGEKYDDQLIDQAKLMAGSMTGNFEVVVLGKQKTIENIQNYTFDAIETDKIVAGLFVKFDVTNGNKDVLFTIYYNFGLQFSKKQNSNIRVTYDGSEYWYLEVVEENKTIVFEYSVTV